MIAFNPSSRNSETSLATGFVLVATLCAAFSYLQAESTQTAWDWQSGFGMPVCFFSLVVLYIYGVLRAHVSLAEAASQLDETIARLEGGKDEEDFLGWVLDQDGIVRQGTGNGLVPGLDPTALQGLPYVDFVAAEDRPQVQGQLKRVVGERCVLENLDHRLLLASGDTIWVRLCGAPAGDSDYRLHAVHISDWKGTELALREKEQELRAVIDLLPGLFYRCIPGDKHSFIFVNPEIETLTGYSMADFLSQRRVFRELAHPDDRAVVEASIEKAIQSKTPYEMNYRLLHASGDTKVVMERGRASYDPMGNVLHLDGAVIDLTRGLSYARTLAAAQPSV